MQQNVNSFCDGVHKKFKLVYFSYVCACGFSESTDILWHWMGLKVGWRPSLI